ncbi:FMN-dependent NADH-azoreductase [Iodobacter fluviatilis]|uniref:FMN dependent NADH:quinone oxidoreductase n=1 Tax=Iodobacter fluviatilis TaxID=537 RepID=A0A7G3G7E5_9NEIS|nr:NAD(P)H-dependent oxidoreductase [Iodobacter fluviatilis]QBC43038.1 FMN-dependent NADH-azoreductase [Iodobacter fluviatilis]
MNILQINSSARSNGAFSTQLANVLATKLLNSHAGSTLVLRDLATNPHPVLDEATLAALMTAAEARTAAQAASVAKNDALIAEVQAADTLIIATPMYNFGITAQLKNWIDAIARAGVTFKYGTNGPEGLLIGKKVYVVLTRGGVHRGTTGDTIADYMRTVLGFLGMSQVEFIYAEGLNMGDEMQSKGISQAHSEIELAVA